MIVAVALGLGLLLGLLAGGTLGGLAEVRLRGESALVALVLGTALLPRVFEWSAPRWHGALLAVWAVGIAILVWLAWLNVRTPGIGLIGVGLALNAVVIIANGGMPVDPRAAGAMGEALAAALAGSAFHMPSGAATRLPLLGDVMPVPWVSLVVSIGDVLMLVGIAAFLVWAMRRGGKGGLAAERD